MLKFEPRQFLKQLYHRFYVQIIKWLCVKIFSEICYHERTCIAFKMKEQCFGHIHDIVCPNEHKIGTCVHCGMASNVAKQRFRHFSQKNPLFIFQVLKVAFFVKRVPRKSSKMAPLNCFHKVEICIFELSAYFWPFKRLPADSVGNG